MFIRLESKSRQGPKICNDSLMHNIHNHQRSPTSKHLWSSISTKICQGTFFLKKRSSTLDIVEISLQKSSYIASVNAFCTARHLVTCHLVAYGRTATACHHMIWLHSQTHPIHTIAASVPQLSSSTTLQSWIHLPGYFPAVTLICLTCNRGLCIPAKQSIITS